MNIAKVINDGCVKTSMWRLSKTDPEYGGSCTKEQEMLDYNIQVIYQPVRSLKEIEELEK